MMHDNYNPATDSTDPVYTYILMDGEPTKDWFYIIYLNMPCESFKLSNAMLVQVINGSYHNENTPEVNLDNLIKGRVLKHIGPLPYRT